MKHAGPSCRALGVWLATAVCGLLLVLPGRATNYFVNDTSTNNDQWCSAPGSTTNNGLSGSSPKASINALLAAVSLTNNDTVYIDTGSYALSGNVVLTNSGGPGARITLRGVPNGTFLDRGSKTNGAACIEVRASFITIESLRCANASVGIFADAAGCRDLQLYGNTCCSNSGPGIKVAAGSGTNGSFQIVRNLVYANGAGLTLERDATAGDRFLITNNTVCVTNGAAVALGGQTADSWIRNNIFEASVTGACLDVVVAATNALPLTDYNCYYVHDGGIVALLAVTNQASKTLGTLPDWQRCTTSRGGLDAHSTCHDPLFASPGFDFHERAKNGRWISSGPGASGFWTYDSMQSLCIDAGAPGVAFNNEPGPNGGRINLGAYGNTPFASRSDTDRWVLAMAPDYGQVVGQTQAIHWIASGTGWNYTTDTVRLDYSLDGGGSWNGIVTTTPVSNGYYGWLRPTNSFDSPSGCLVRVAYSLNISCSGTAQLVAQTHQSCFYYVNDGTTGSDLWCTQPGNDGNDGLSPGTPLASLQTLLGRYTLGAGDRVYVDTGTYFLSSNVVVESRHGGTAASPVRLIGACRAAVFDRQNGGAGSRCIELHGNHVSIEGFACRRAEVGIFVDASTCRAAEIHDNTVCSNSAAGVRVQAATGLSDGWFVVARNLAFANGSGLDLQGEAESGDGFCVSNNTVVVTNGCAVAVGGAMMGSYVYHNIGVASSGGVCFAVNGSAVADADYNDWYAPGVGAVGAALAGTNLVAKLDALSAWQVFASAPLYPGYDRHTLSRDPSFAGAAAGDLHLRSSGGRWVPSGPTQGVWNADADALTSPCIDAGAPSAGVDAEPSPNGARVNLGAFGGTAEASKTPTNRRLVALAPAQSTAMQLYQPIYWNPVGMGWQAGETMRIEYSLDGGSQWLTITTNAEAAWGSYTWMRPSDSFDSLQGCLVRVASGVDGAVADIVDLGSNVRCFYVNDGSVTNDVWCTQTGSDSNDGLSPATPVASLQTLLSRYTLGSNDYVFVDAGYYPLTSNLVIGSQHSGDYSHTVRILGTGRNTILDRQSQATNTCCLEVHASHISIMGFTCVGAQVGIFVSAADCREAEIGGNYCLGNSLLGLRVMEGANDGALFAVHHNVFAGGAGGMELEAGATTYGDSFHVYNNTVTATNGVAIKVGGNLYDTSLNHNILAVGGNAFGVFVTGNGTLSSDYNDFHLKSGGRAAMLTGGGSNMVLSTLADWQSWYAASYVQMDAHSFSRDPLFADAAGNDYHLCSLAGRWKPGSGSTSGSWVTDSALHSPCIDAGDPARTADAALEPAPNGGRVNLGAFGSTGEASKSRSGRALLALLPDAGQDTWEQQYVSWNATGSGWQTNDTVRLSYSLDGGATWIAIPDAQSLAAADSGYYWYRPSDSFLSVSGCAVRVTCNADASVNDSAWLPAIVKAYYVNDGSTTNDFWCTQPGSDAADGCSPGTPMASLQTLLDRYTLNPGDVVYVDAGQYALAGNVVVSSRHTGNWERPLRLQGASRRTVLNRQSRVAGAYALDIQTPYVMVDGFQFTGADIGVHVAATNSMGAWITHNVCRGNARFGIRIEASPGTYATLEVRHNVLFDNGAGVQLTGHGSYHNCNLTLKNNTIVVTKGAGVSVSDSAYSANVKNNIIEASVSGVALEGDDAWALYSDYNDYFVHDGGTFRREGSGTGYTTYAELTDWQLGQSSSRYDEHSFSRNPLFANAAGGDYHVCSRGGRWQSLTTGGMWVMDTVHSPCIDAGDPAEGDISAEPAPNGGRVNLGAFGNTAEASKSAPTRILQLTGFVEPNAATQTVALTWWAGGQGWGTTDTVRLEYSLDGGKRWYVVPGAQMLPYGTGTFSWVVGTFADATLAGQALRVRITCNQDGTVRDEIVLGVQAQSTAVSYYVNDGSLTNDVYCTATGSAANSGLTPAAPLDSLARLLASRRLNPGDTVYVDTGYYPLTNAASLPATSCGTPDRPVRIVGSVNGSVLDLGGGSTATTGVLELEGNCVRVERLTCIRGKVGIAVNAATCQQATLVANVCCSNAQAGVEVKPWSAGGGIQYQILENVCWGNGRGLVLQGQSDATLSRAVFLVENNTLAAGGEGAALVCRNGGATGWRTTVIKNNILCAGGSGRICLDILYGSLSYSDFNNFDTASGGIAAVWTDAGGNVAGIYTGVAEWRAATGFDGSSLGVDSGFVSPGTGDLRLSASSACVDAGILSYWMADALDAAGRTRIFGPRVDMGAYESSRHASLRVFLQGPYQYSQHAMGEGLADAGLLPFVSPYAADPRAASGIASGAVDWVLVQLRENPDGAPVLSRSVFLRGDGWLVTDSGSTNLPLTLPAGTNFYVSIKHRNHLAALAATPVSFTNETFSYDFTAASTRYWNSGAAVSLGDGAWGSAAGDVDGDGAIRPVDRTIAESQTELYGYHRGDLNLDGWIDTASDLFLVDGNLNRTSGIVKPETVLLPMMRLLPSQTARVSGDTETFTAVPVLSSNLYAVLSGGSEGDPGAICWGFTTNASGATLTSDGTSNALYTAGSVTGCVDLVEAWNPVSDALGRSAASVLGSDEVARAGQVILVAGRKSAGDSLWPVTDYLTDLAYTTLRYRGFARSDIHYFNPEPDQDVDGNGLLDDIEGASTLANVAAACSNACAGADRLFLYLADHGGDSSGNGFFRLSSEETLSAAQLRSWLDALQDAHHTEVTVLLDFCYAGSFVDELAYTGTARRIVIAACSSNQPTYFVAGGMVSFSQSFFSGVLLGYDVFQCFQLARDAMTVYQAGQLDDDRSGAYVEGIDGADATGYYIGPSGVAGSDAPVIGEVCGNQVLTEETSATLWVADVTSLQPIERVWCQIVPPGFSPDPENPVTALPEFDLTYDAESGRYSVSYDAFTAPGTYMVLFYASDAGGRVSAPRQCYVAQVGYDDRLILVAGGPTNTPVWTATEYLATLATAVFRLRLYDAAHVRTLAPVTPWDLDLDGSNDVAALPSGTALQEAITGWAASNSTDRLTLYLMGSGSNNTLRLNESETLDGATLAGWLDAFQTTNPVPVYVILDFAGAGAFVSALATTNPATGEAYDRIVIASTQSGADALFNAGGAVSFSQYLLSGILAGETLGDAYTTARRTIRRVSGGVRQRACIDDNGDGVANEKNVDGTVADGVHLGSAFLTGEDTPVIGAVTPLTVLPDNVTTVLLWAADISGVAGISNVWCTITPPDYAGEGELTSVSLAWNVAASRYEALTGGFALPGAYMLTFGAVDSNGVLAAVVPSEVVRADAFEPDNDASSPSLCYGPAQAHTFHAATDVDWVRFYLVSNLVYEISTTHFSTNLDTVLDLYRLLPDGTLESVDHVDEEGDDEGEYTGLDYPEEGFYYARLSSYAADGTNGYVGSYEFSVDTPAAGSTYTLVVLGLNSITAGALPTNASASCTGQGSKTFSGSTSVSFPGLTNGYYTVTVPTPTNFFPREDPNTANQVGSLTNLYYANPRQIRINGGWYMTGFEMIPWLTVGTGVVRDAWTHAYVGSAAISFQSTSGSLTGYTAQAHVIYTSYGTNWASQANGRFPTNVILSENNWNLSVGHSGYITNVVTNAVNGAVRGSVLDLGTIYLVPVDTNANQIADDWEQRYFPGVGAAPTNDPDHDGVNNLNEYLSGTNPTNGSDVLHFTNFTVSVTGTVSLSWNVVAGHGYRVDACTSLTSTAWNTIGGVWEAAYGTSGMSWTSAPALGPRFYRVAVTNY
jgi:hypothetical protein